MSIVVIFNKIRTGKTCTLTYVGALYWLKGHDIYADYHLKIPHTFVRSLEDLNFMRKGKYLADDFYMKADSRDFKRNKFVNLVLAKSGKRRIDIYYTATAPGEIDKKIRRNTDYAWIPEMYLFPGTRIPWYMVVRRYFFIPEPKDELRWIGDEYAPPLILNHSQLMAVFPLYDTEEEVDPFE